MVPRLPSPTCLEVIRRNRGIREADCGIFLPLDADNRLRPGFVEAALDVLAQDKSVMAVSGFVLRLRNFDFLPDLFG